MARTQIRGQQILDGSVKRKDLNVDNATNAVIRKIIAGTNVSLDSTGAATGTGDVTINVASTIGVIPNGDWIYWRNAEDDEDYAILRVNSDNDTQLNAGRDIIFRCGANNRWRILQTQGHLVPILNNSYDVGQSSEIVRTIYANEVRYNNKIHVAGQEWARVDEAWTYASASTITVPSGATSRFRKGDKLRLTNSTVKYFYVIGVSSTTLTITGGSSYTLTNTTISNISVCRGGFPIDFPSNFGYSTGVNPQAGSVSSTIQTISAFKVIEDECHYYFDISWTQGSSSAAYVDINLPISPQAALPNNCPVISPDGTFMSGFSANITSGGGRIRIWAYDQRAITVGNRAVSGVAIFVI